MNEPKISKTEARSLSFLLRADEFYILTRYCHRAFLQLSTFRMAHHALEYYLKSGLAYSMTLEELKKLGHKIQSLWKEYKRHVPDLSLDDRIIEHLDRFEAMRYPGSAKFVRTAWGQPYEDLFENVLPKVPEHARDSLACFCMRDIDRIVHLIRSSIPHGDELPIIVVGEHQERYLFHDNEYFTKEDNEPKLTNKLRRVP
jgi:HEPN domain-containing protein